ncbi:MAG TPA: hypothetical protein VG452_04830 [Egibacteraceae bacterium]|nr:hypothetical protein [Egibacteraceae bacterium]
MLLLVDGSGDGDGPAERFLQAHRDRVGQVLLFDGAAAIGDPVG